MDEVYSVSEVIELGIQIERNGRDFYEVLARQSKNPVIAEVFKFLSQEEEKHIVTFKQILEKAGQYQLPQVYADEYFAYINLLASNYVFTQKNKGEEIAISITSDMQAVDLGIGFEKDSIVFYEGIKKAVLEKEPALIGELIKEEEKHLKKLMDLKVREGKL